MSLPEKIKITGDITPVGIKSLTLDLLPTLYEGNPQWGYNADDNGDPIGVPYAVLYWSADGGEKARLTYQDSENDYHWSTAAASINELSFPLVLEINFRSTGTATVEEYNETTNTQTTLTARTDTYRLTRDLILYTKKQRRLRS
jgi:hypothetical protein